MNNLIKRVNDHIKNSLLNFSNFKDDSIIAVNFKEDLINRLCAKQWAKYSQTDAARQFARERIGNIIDKQLPFILCFCFGGYKHYWSSAFPEVDWAEIFNIRQLIQYIYPAIVNYKPGVTIEYESEEVALSLMNNIPQEDLDKYNASFKKLLDYAKTAIPQLKIEFSYVLAKELYNKDELIKKMLEYRPVVEQRFAELSEEEKQIRLRRAETNIMWKGVKDLTQLNEEERKKAIYDSRILNEAFLDIDYELRGTKYFEKENLLPLVGTFGLGAGGDFWLHIASCKSSFVDFWAGIGILEVRENRIIEKIISQKQFESIKNQLIKVDLKLPKLEAITKNFSYIYVYEGQLNF